MTSFVKLNKQFDIFGYTSGNMEISYGGVIGYFSIKNLESDLLSVVPTKYKNAFSISEMKISDAVPPHTDSYVKSVINFYLKPNNYRTVFFGGNSPTYQIKNQTSGRMFFRENLVELDSFIAKEGEAFCLNVENPHAVDPLDEDPKERVAICLSTGDYDFEQVCNMLYDTGHLN